MEVEGLWSGLRVGILGRIVNPICDEDVDFARILGITGRAENEFFAIAGKHREAIEAGSIGNAFQPRTIFVDDVKAECTP